jgi:uncharacterized protein DUF4058
MTSPFPGMDPYIEACRLWDDFHFSLMGEIQRALAEVVPAHYVVRQGERAYISQVRPEKLATERNQMQGDVSISLSLGRSPAKNDSNLAVLEQPLTALEAESVSMVALEQVEFREPFVEIRSLDPERSLVTTIEVLSPSNKRRGTKGWKLYQRKRVSHLTGQANLIEIDLLRGSGRLPMITPWPDSPYALLVSRRERAPYCKVWRASFASPLPTIPVPLAKPDPDVTLSLQPLIDAIYVRSRYASDIDYRKPCVPPLAPAEVEWLNQRLTLPEQLSR